VGTKALRFPARNTSQQTRTSTIQKKDTNARPLTAEIKTQGTLLRPRSGGGRAGFPPPPPKKGIPRGGRKKIIGRNSSRGYEATGRFNSKSKEIHPKKNLVEVQSSSDPLKAPQSRGAHVVH